MMDDLSSLSEASLSHAHYKPCATYYLSSDCVEYVREDGLCIYKRVDNFLTLIFDETKLNLIGFKLKGFKHIFEKHLKPLWELHDMQFIELISAIEAVFATIGDAIFAGKDHDRANAYKAALKLAANDNVKLSGALFAKAA